MKKRTSFVKLLQERIKEDEWEIIKEKYRSEVNSNRRFEQILNLEELLSILEDRLILTSSNVEVLKIITENIEGLKNKEYTITDYFYEELNETVLSEEDIERVSSEYENSYKAIGRYLLINQNQLSKCNNIEDVLDQFHIECRRVSPQEMKFRLNRAISKVESK